jgi:ferredoxin
MKDKRYNQRMYVRLGCFLLVTFLLLPFPFRIDGSRLFVQASAFVTICSILAGGTIWVGSILGLVFSIISLWRKRWSCRYVCPVGLLLDTVSGMKFPGRIWWKGCPPIGRYIVLLTVAGAVVGYPLFLWMDPLAFFSNAFSVYKVSDVPSVLISLSGMVILILLALTSGNFWCARICPLGATQDLLEGIGAFCINFRKPVKIDSEKTTAHGNIFPATRRMFITIAAGLGLSLLAQKVVRARSKDVPLRPPGAIEEDEFTGLCLRCGNCIRTCPSGIIHPDMGQAGILGFLAPLIRYETDYCNEECNVCTEVCPSGALQTLNLEQKLEYVIGLAIVNRSLCLWGISDCNTCVHSCPLEAVKIFWDEEAYESYPAVDPLKCNGCGACEAYCPTGDLKAITVVKNTDRKTLATGS